MATPNTLDLGDIKKWEGMQPSFTFPRLPSLASRMEEVAEQKNFILRSKINDQLSTSLSQVPPPTLPINQLLSHSTPEAGYVFPKLPSLADGMDESAFRRTQQNLISDVISANTALRRGDVAGAEYVLGRKLTTEEISNRTITPQIRQNAAGADMAVQLHGAVVGEAVTTKYNEKAQKEKIIQAYLLDRQKRGLPVLPTNSAEKQSVSDAALNAAADNAAADNADASAKLEKEGQSSLDNWYTQVAKGGVQSGVNTAVNKGVNTALDALGNAVFPIVQKSLGFGISRGKGQIGGFVVDMHKLHNNNELSLQYLGSRRKIWDHPNIGVSDNFKAVIHNIVHKKKYHTNNLTENENKYLANLLKRSSSSTGRGLNRRANMHQEQVDAGEIDAGNDSTVLKHNLHSLLQRMVQSKEMSYQQAKGIMKKYR